MVEPVGIGLQAVSFSIGDFALDRVSLDVAAGEYLVLMGPNGAGKTILIKLIAGILVPDAGSVYVGGQDVTGLPPWERGVGFLPQDYALFPDRTVFRNISFGLEVRGLPRDEVKAEVHRAAEMLNMSHLLDRRPDTLSGGEAQKAALARALVIRPRVLLLDEPVSAIDEENREVVCRELKGVQKTLGVTTVHVSHSRTEAELVADRVVLLSAGVIGPLEPNGESGT